MNCPKKKEDPIVECPRCDGYANYLDWDTESRALNPLMVVRNCTLCDGTGEVNREKAFVYKLSEEVANG